MVLSASKVWLRFLLLGGKALAHVAMAGHSHAFSPARQLHDIAPCGQVIVKTLPVHTNNYFSTVFQPHGNPPPTTACCSSTCVTAPSRFLSMLSRLAPDVGRRALSLKSMALHYNNSSGRCVKQERPTVRSGVAGSMAHRLLTPLW